MSDEQPTKPEFRDLNLAEPILRAIESIGYETPSPIQAAIIPKILSGKDVVGQAQTGTGKTAAFALPLLSKVDPAKNVTQALILAPTRELAIQVAEAFQSYAVNLKNFHVLPIYGGQNYTHQLRQLKRGAHIVVGTPGRVMDHMRRGTLILENLSCLVLDEADEMLRMGFIDDVEWILEQTPKNRQIALLSATMPKEIRHIAKKYLNTPEEITIKTKTVTAPSIHQRYWAGPNNYKLDALTRILEFEPFDAVLIFVRTKKATGELSEKLEARGYASSPLNGDIVQAQRERTIDRFKKGHLDVVVATDVAARGLDVERITHVINYDIPSDTEAYTHRIGRTGRAGRKGEAILFITPREKRLLRSIEQATKQPIEAMPLPSTEVLNEQRVENFKQKITETLETETGLFQKILKEYQEEHDVDPLDIAAALAKMSQGRKPLLLKDLPKPAREPRSRDRDERGGERGERRPRRRESGGKPEEGMDRFRIEVGSTHGVKPGNIVGAIANEAGINSRYIGPIHIMDNYTIVDLPADMSKEVCNHLSKVWVSGQQLKLSRSAEASSERTPSGGRHRRGGENRNDGRRSGNRGGEQRSGAPARNRGRRDS